ncbi:MAG: hypothetical protein ACLFT3_15975, partial [Cyclobacteriaceae bacterium]
MLRNLHFLSSAQQLQAALALIVLLFNTVSLHAQTGPGGVGNANGATGQPENLMWLDASSLSLSDGAAVNSWTDRSGNGRNATISDTGREPAYTFGVAASNNRQFIRFDESSPGDRLDLPSTLSSELVGSNYTVFVVGARRATNAARWFGGTDGDDAQNFAAGWETGTNYRYEHGGVGITHNPGGTVDDANVFNIFTHRFNAALGSQQRDLLFNGGDRSTNDNGSSIAGWTGAALGRWKTAYYNIDLAEVIFYGAALNDAQRTIVENYLSAKYGTGISNDRYAGDDPANGDFDFDVVGIGRDGGASHTQSNSAGFILSTYDGTFNTDGEYLMAGHNGVANTTATDSLQTGVQERWARSWYVDKTTAGTVNAALTFDLGEGIPSGQFPQEANNYVLLRRNGATYDSVEVADKIITGDQITFRVEDANLTDGIYTLGSTNAAVSPVEGLPGRTWYSYQSGNWNNPNAWTLDGGVSPLLVNPGDEYPGTDDHVVITSGRTITMNIDNQTVASMEVTGRLDMAATSGHD